MPKAIEEMTREELLVLLSKKSGKSARTSETTIREKYKHLNIVEGSLGWNQAASGGAGKQYVTVVCDCGAEVRRYTSDLFTFKGCPACKAALGKATKIERRQLERTALARLEALTKASALAPVETPVETVG